MGYNDRTYRGNQAITRAEFTAMAARFFDVYGDGAEEIMEQYEALDDVSDGYWLLSSIKDAAIHGWVEGYGDGTFRADDPIDRAEVVTIVNRLLGREADEDYIVDNRRKLVTFPDVSPAIGPTTRCWRPPTATPLSSPTPKLGTSDPTAVPRPTAGPRRFYPTIHSTLNKEGEMHLC